MENKVGPYPPRFGLVKIQQESILYKCVSIYNRLKPELTKIRKRIQLKKWLKRAKFSQKLDVKLIKNNEHNKLEDIEVEIDLENIQKCQNIISCHDGYLRF